MPRCSKKQKLDEELQELATFPLDLKRIIIQYWFFGHWLPTTGYWQHRRLLDQCMRTILQIGHRLDRKCEGYILQVDGHYGYASDPWPGQHVWRRWNYYEIVRDIIRGWKFVPQPRDTLPPRHWMKSY